MVGTGISERGCLPSTVTLDENILQHPVVAAPEGVLGQEMWSHLHTQVVKGSCEYQFINALVCFQQCRVSMSCLKAFLSKLML